MTFIENYSIGNVKNKLPQQSQSLLTQKDIIDLLQWYNCTLENKNILLNDAAVSSKEERYHDAYGYAALTSAMDPIEWDESVCSKANHNAWYYLQQLLKKDPQEDTFNKAKRYFQTALDMRWWEDQFADYQKTANMYIATIKDYIKNTKELEEGLRIDNIESAFTIGYNSIRKKPQSPQVRMISSNLAYLLFEEAQRNNNEQLWNMALFFNNCSLIWAKKEIAEKRLKLTDKINDFLSTTEFWNTDKDTEDYDVILGKSWMVRSLLDKDNT